MASQKFISGGASALTVRARQRLGTLATAKQFTNELIAVLEHHGNKGTSITFEDFDISQNKISYATFETIFAALQSWGVRVKRFRLFGCPTLDDANVTLLAAWLSTVTAATAPTEIHLSDCAITDDGFLQLIGAIEENSAFPTPDPVTHKLVPMYLRLENNYISENILQEKINSGVMYTFQKNNERIRDVKPGHDYTKVKLFVLGNASFRQNEGKPPPPEDAPLPKRVHDRVAKEGEKMDAQRPTLALPWLVKPALKKGAWTGSGARGMDANGGDTRGVDKRGMRQQEMQPPWRATVSENSTRKWSDDSWKMRSHVHSRPATQSGRAVLTAFKDTLAFKGAAAVHSSLASGMRRENRSRTPPQRNRSANSLPQPWEEHWSEEYGLPYYWNRETDKSVWERPVKACQIA